MKKNISIAVALLFVLGGFNWVNAETAVATSADVSVTTMNTGATTAGAAGIAIDEPGVPKPKQNNRQTPKRDFGDRAKELRASTTANKREVRGQTKESRKEMEKRAKELHASNTEGRKEVRGEMNDRREQMEKHAKELRASSTVAREKMKDKEQKKRLEKAQKQLEMISKRLDGAIERVQKLSDRVTERLNKLEKDGINVTVSRGHILEAKAKLDEARTKVAAVKLSIEVALTTGATRTATSTSPKDVMKDVQDAVRETVKIIQEAHKHVVLAISTIKPGYNKQRPATTTPATTTATTTQ